MQQEIKFIVRVLAERRVALPARLLELRCATGRRATALARVGFDVVGLDSSPIMIDVAARYGDDALGPHAACFSVGDARSLEHHDPFDVIIESSTSMGHGSMENDERILTSIRSALVPGGVVLVEVALSNRVAEFTKLGSVCRRAGLQQIEFREWPELRGRGRESTGVIVACAP